MSVADILGYLKEFGRFIVVAASAAVVVVIALSIRSIMRRTLKPRIALHVYNTVEKVVFYGILVLGIIFALSPLGIDLTGVLLAGGIAGIVIGFAAQTSVSNLISGIFLHIDRSLKVGDSVSIGDISGQVIDIDVFSTRIRAWDGYIVRIPNDKVFSSTISNFSNTVARRIVLRIGISYNSDIGRARNAIMKVFNEHPFVLVNPPPDVYVEEFGNSAIILVARCWTPAQLWFQTRMELLERIREEFRREGIEIPYPQLDLHVKEKVELVLSPRCSEHQQTSV